MNKDTILDEITRFYLNSRDFNGIHSTELSRRLGIGFRDFFGPLRELIAEKKLGILYEPQFVNPSIIRRGFEPEDNQIERLTNLENELFCLYPRPVHLKRVVNCSDYTKEPYKLELALGCPQLDFRSFDLTVLEYYRNEPRYMYETDDIKGHICYECESMSEHDKTMLESFGFSYDVNLNRAVAVVLRYLARLSPGHQQYWKLKEIEEDFKVHPDYIQNNILGEFREHESIFTAFVDELHLICKITAAINGVPLFRTDFRGSFKNRPEKFSFLIRPTLEEFNGFVHLLDKMISENINKKFFKVAETIEPETVRKGRKIQAENKGTLQLLRDWVKKFVPTDDLESWCKAINTFWEIRDMRQKPAHVIKQNAFDQKYFKEQRDLMICAYDGMRILRMILENHPKAIDLDITVPDYLREGKIRTI